MPLRGSFRNSIFGTITLLRAIYLVNGYLIWFEFLKCYHVSWLSVMGTADNDFMIYKWPVIIWHLEPYCCQLNLEVSFFEHFLFCEETILKTCVTFFFFLVLSNMVSKYFCSKYLHKTLLYCNSSSRLFMKRSTANICCLKPDFFTYTGIHRIYLWKTTSKRNLIHLYLFILRLKTI